MCIYIFALNILPNCPRTPPPKCVHLPSVCKSGCFPEPSLTLEVTDLSVSNRPASSERHLVVGTVFNSERERDLCGMGGLSFSVNSLHTSSGHFSLN